MEEYTIIEADQDYFNLDAYSSFFDQSESEEFSNDSLAEDLDIFESWAA